MPAAALWVTLFAVMWACAYRLGRGAGRPVRDVAGILVVLVIAVGLARGGG